MPTRNHHYLSIDDLSKARGADATLAFDGRDPQSLAMAVQDALRSPALFERWRARQPDPDQVDPALGVTDVQAEASAELVDLRVDLHVTTTLPMQVVKQRLNWLLGSGWQLRDIRSV